jgi:hypothetical protein
MRTSIRVSDFGWSFLSKSKPPRARARWFVGLGQKVFWLNLFEAPPLRFNCPHCMLIQGAMSKGENGYYFSFVQLVRKGLRFDLLAPIAASLAR